MVVADTYRAAQDAAERVEVEYEVLPATASAVAALAPEAPRVWDEASDNLCYDWEIGDKAAVDAAFAGAAHLTRLEVVHNRRLPNAIHPPAATGPHPRAPAAPTPPPQHP